MFVQFFSVYLINLASVSGQFPHLAFSEGANVLALGLLLLFVFSYLCYKQLTPIKNMKDVLRRESISCPTFSNLRTLALGEWCIGTGADFDILIRLLQHSPSWEKLYLHLEMVCTLMCGKSV